MKLPVGVILFLFAATFFSPRAAEKARPSEPVKITAVKVVRPTKKRVVVHAGPVRNGVVVGYVLQRDTLLVADARNGFDRVFISGYCGWIPTAFLKTDSAASENSRGREMNPGEFICAPVSNYFHLADPRNVMPQGGGGTHDVLYVKMLLLDSLRRACDAQEAALRRNGEKQEQDLRAGITLRQGEEKKRLEASLDSIQRQLLAANTRLEKMKQEQSSPPVERVNILREEFEAWEIGQKSRLEALRKEKIAALMKKQDSLDAQKSANSRMGKLLKSKGDQPSAETDSLRRQFEAEQKKLKMAGLEMERFRKITQEELVQTRKTFDYEKKQNERELADKIARLEKEGREDHQIKLKKFEEEAGLLEAGKAKALDSLHVFERDMVNNLESEYAQKAADIRLKIAEGLKQVEKERAAIGERQKELERGNSSGEGGESQANGLMEERKRLAQEKAELAAEKKAFQEERKAFEGEKKRWQDDKAGKK